MKEKDTADTCQCDDTAAGAMAAASMAKFFKDQNWKIISFFPNTPCSKKVKALLQHNKAPKTNQKPS